MWDWSHTFKGSLPSNPKNSHFYVPPFKIMCQKKKFATTIVRALQNTDIEDVFNTYQTINVDGELELGFSFYPRWNGIKNIHTKLELHGTILTVQLVIGGDLRKFKTPVKGNPQPQKTDKVFQVEINLKTAENAKEFLNGTLVAEEDKDQIWIIFTPFTP
jgi:hypothetical protein